MKEPFDYGKKRPDGQFERHPGMPEDEGKYVAPIRAWYIHKKCGAATRMPNHCATTYAKNPTYYGSTFCCGCNDYFPLKGHDPEGNPIYNFSWAADPTENVGELSKGTPGEDQREKR